jgi:dienelactone hydrolase
MTQTEPVPTGLAVLEMAQAGRFAEIHDLFAPQLRELVPAEALQAAWAAMLANRGPVRGIGVPVSESAGPGTEVTTVLIPVTFERGELTVVVFVGENGWLTGIQVAPASAAQQTGHWEAPPYADPETFEEQEVTVGSDPLAVPGTLSLPHQRGLRPAVVLLAGSGPADRDETIGRNKPLKDLAWGLASRGVAVLRFDKVTYVHPGQVVQTCGFTITDEYVPHAVAAIDLLRQHSAIDPARVFVAGHSLGSTALPRVAMAEPLVAGLVVVAGGAQPLHWAAVRQIRYLASLDPRMVAAAQPAIAVITRQAETVDGPSLPGSTPDGELPFGVAAPYWQDLRSYDPAAATAALSKPVLIIQGGRDYQATVADDLTRWTGSLAGQPDVTIRFYPHDNLFFRGIGPSVPAEYGPAQHMDPVVVTDIANWLTSARPAPGASTRPRKGRKPRAQRQPRGQRQPRAQARRPRGG